jgi:hypothetical protein
MGDPVFLAADVAEAKDINSKVETWSMTEKTFDQLDEFMREAPRGGVVKGIEADRYENLRKIAAQEFGNARQRGVMTDSDYDRYMAVFGPEVTSNMEWVDVRARAIDALKQLRKGIHRERSSMYEQRGLPAPPMRMPVHPDDVEAELRSRGVEVAPPVPTETPAERDSREVIDQMEGTVDPFTLETKKRTGSVR